jgi:hypothetical protein
MSKKEEPLLEFLKSDIPERLYLSLYQGRKLFLFQNFLDYITRDWAGGRLENEDDVIEALRYYRDHFEELPSELRQPIQKK